MGAHGAHTREVGQIASVGLAPESGLRALIERRQFKQVTAAFAPGTEHLRTEVARRVEASVPRVQAYVQQRVAHLDDALSDHERLAMKDSQDLSIANGTRLMAQWILTGHASSRNEMGGVSFVGRRQAHVHGNAGRLLRAYFAARDAVKWVIAAACEELGAPSGVATGLLVGTDLAYDRSAIRAIEQFDDRAGAVAVELERERSKLAQLANTDPLTGVSNRRGLYEHLAGLVEHAPSRGPRPGAPAAVVFFVDLDGFKQLNDRFGHRVRDDVLRVVAERLRGAARPADCVARFGGDEFVMVMSGFPDQLAVVDETAQRILDAVRAPIVADGQVVGITASLGVAQAEQMPVDPDMLLGAADRALYVAKASGCDTFRYSATPGTALPVPAAKVSAI